MPAYLAKMRTSKTDTLTLTALLAASCFVQLLTDSLSPTLAETEGLSLWLTIAPVGLGSALIFVGVLWPGTNFTALQVEFVGRAFVWLPSMLYCAAIGFQVGLPGVVSAAFLGAFGTSSAWRGLKIYRCLRRVVRPR